MSFGEHVIHLNDGREMPVLGLGVYKATEDEELKQAISSAVSWGYRLIDTASFYKNEEGVGKGIQALDIPREDRLGLDYVDLYLIHWPVPGCFGNTWKAMEKLREQGKVKSIGVSNFSIQDLELLKTVSDVVPAVNQVEFHPLFNHPDLKAYCQENGIALQAYAPLARGAYLKSPLMIEIGKNHQKSPAQVGLRWLIQQGIAVIPKSVHEKRLEENSQIFDFVLTDEEMAAITAMDVQHRVAGIPEDMLPYIV